MLEKTAFQKLVAMVTSNLLDEDLLYLIDPR